MNKLFIYTMILVAGVFLSSCEKEDILDTATVNMAGDWYVTADAVDADGEIVYKDEDLFGIGSFHLDTYNSASNESTNMWIDDNGNFWDFKAKMDINYSEKTFDVADFSNASYEGCLVNISEGKILYDAATTTPSGAVADSIVFYISFSDDDYPAAYGYSKYRIAGYRYTGLAADE